MKDTEFVYFIIHVIGFHLFAFFNKCQ